MELYIVIALIATVLIYVVYAYNKLVVGKNDVHEAFSTMDVYLKKRYDLIPAIVAAVKQYSLYESDLLLNLTQERNIGEDLNHRVSQEGQISDLLNNIKVRVENYPKQKVSQSYLELQQKLDEIESDIASSRRYYNACVKLQNTRIQQVPSCVVAKMGGFTLMPLYIVAEEERSNISIE